MRHAHDPKCWTRWDPGSIIPLFCEYNKRYDPNYIFEPTKNLLGLSYNVCNQEIEHWYYFLVF